MDNEELIVVTLLRISFDIKQLLWNFVCLFNFPHYTPLKLSTHIFSGVSVLRSASITCTNLADRESVIVRNAFIFECGSTWVYIHLD